MRIGCESFGSHAFNRSAAALSNGSSVFATERATTFTDLWHFADPGHALLAERIAPALLEVLGRRGPG